MKEKNDEYIRFNATFTFKLIIIKSNFEGHLSKSRQKSSYYTSKENN